MGDKVVARTTAAQAGVPVVPGSDGPVTDLAEAHRVAEDIGYPILVKAAGGGGGIGMALVKKASKLEAAISSCQDRGRSSFGNSAVYLKNTSKVLAILKSKFSSMNTAMASTSSSASARFNGDIKKWWRKPHPPSSVGTRL